MTLTDRAIRSADDRHNKWWLAIIAVVLIFGTIDAAIATWATVAP